jgi:hypothetical protein
MLPTYGCQLSLTLTCKSIHQEERASNQQLLNGIINKYTIAELQIFYVSFVHIPLSNFWFTIVPKFYE